jgi:ribosomal protein S18 acetylase RimI-like enzyme
VISRLQQQHEPCLSAFLRQDPVSGLFLLGVLHATGIEGAPGRFYGAGLADGVERGCGRLGAVAYLADTGLLVPEARDLALVEELVPVLQSLWWGVRVVVGPREAVELLWQGCHRWGRDQPPRLWRGHLLHGLEEAELVDGPEERALRRALPGDLDELVVAAAAMRQEELGEDPLHSNPLPFRSRVAQRIDAGISWLVRDRLGIAFKVDVGTLCPEGAQLEGVYTRPDRRGEGLAARSLRRLCRLLLAEVPQVTLHVWEENAPALACYARVGMRVRAAYRIALR